MTTVIIIALAVALVVAAILSYRRNERAAAIGFGLLAVLATMFLVLPALAGITINWAGLPTVLGAVSVALIGTAIGTGRPFFGALGVVAAAWLACLVFGLSWWVLAFAVVAALFMAADMVTERSIFAVLALVALIASGIAGAQSSDQVRLQAALMGQLNANNQTFTDWDTFCNQAKPGTADKLTCDKVNSLDGRVGTLETKVKTLEGQMATVTEKVDKASVVTKSAGGNTDQEATAALAAQLAAAGWGADDIRINNVSEADHTEQAGTNRFTERIRTRAQLVKYLNSNEPAAKANRELLLKSVPADQHSRLLSGEGYYTVQFMQDSCLDGNSYYKNGSVQLAGIICHQKGDILHIYVGSDGVVYWGATVRDDCGNGHLNKAPTPKDKPKDKPKDTPTSTPTNSVKVCPTGTDRAGEPVGGKPCDNTTTVEKCPPGTDRAGQPVDGKSCNNPPPEEKCPNGKPKNSDGTCPKEGSNPGLNEGTKENNTVNNNDGSKDSQGKQDDPSGNAEKAKQEADAANKAKQEAADKAKSETSTDSGAGDEPQGSTSTGSDSGSSDSGSTGSAGEDTSGSVWGN